MTVQPGGPIPESDAQRRVRRSPLLYTAPIVLLCLLTAVLGWEIVRANMTEEARTDWPWRLQLLDMEPLGSLLAVAAAAVLARAQYARTVRPYLGWKSDWTTGRLRGSAVEWRAGVYNGGQYTAVIERYDCRVVLAGDDSASTPWTDVAGAAATLTGAGLVAGEDFQIPTFGHFPLVGTGTYETAVMGAFSRRFVDEVDAFYVRLRVVDTVGDSHERTMNCLKGARSPGYLPPPS
ncbi:hypothetical protein Q5762_33545 [Streptomyces sp. P9(2023)]|uniref:hypothetical protein n=1 Tax=Streptomyces sp. P9(2023) TaxID=3064394 RepID=UPI0028F4269F|nr:hypothetical protein [Streptomyces sp. P9(2023)]MDT9693164.1 hypothetical protein [Streptomyces sp. P9(2023)]